MTNRYDAILSRAYARLTNPVEREGFDAGEFDHSPYARGTPEHAAWTRGFEEKITIINHEKAR